MAHHCRRKEIKAEKEQRRGPFENKWKLLKCRVMICNEGRMVAHSTRREALMGIKVYIRYVLYQKQE